MKSLSELYNEILLRVDELATPAFYQKIEFAQALDDQVLHLRLWGSSVEPGPTATFGILEEDVEASDLAKIVRHNLDQILELVISIIAQEDNHALTSKAAARTEDKGQKGVIDQMHESIESLYDIQDGIEIIRKGPEIAYIHRLLDERNQEEKQKQKQQQQQQEQQRQQQKPRPYSIPLTTYTRDPRHSAIAFQRQVQDAEEYMYRTRAAAGDASIPGPSMLSQLDRPMLLGSSSSSTASARAYRDTMSSSQPSAASTKSSTKSSVGGDELHKESIKRSYNPPIEGKNPDPSHTTSIELRLIDTETLNHLGIPWESSKTDPRTVTALCKLDRFQMNMLFDHSRRRRLMRGNHEDVPSSLLSEEIVIDKNVKQRFGHDNSAE